LSANCGDDGDDNDDFSRNWLARKGDVHLLSCPNRSWKVALGSII
jgi:hypothetical protein